MQQEIEQLRDALARSEKRARLLMESSADALYVLNREGQFIDVSQRGTETTGYSRDEILAMHLWDLEIDDHWTPEHFVGFFDSQPVGTTITAPGNHRRKDGSCYPVEARINVVELNDEKRLMVFIRDMSDMMAAQERLRGFEALAENAQDAIIMFDTENRVIYANQYANMLYRTETLVGRMATEMWVEEDLPYVQDEVLPQLMRGGFSGEVRQQRSDGTTFETASTAFPILDTEGNIVSFGLIIRDITEQKAADEAVRQSQKLLQTFLDNIPAIIFAKDEDGRLILTNTALTDAYGISKDDLLGKTIYDLMPDHEMADAVWQEELQVIKTRKVNSGEAVTQDIDGNLKYQYQSSFPLINEQDEAYAVGVISMDITEQKKQEQYARRIIENLPEMFFIIATDGTIDRWNPMFEQSTGYNADEIDGAHALKFIYPDDHAIIGDAIQRIFAGESQIVEGRLQRSDGEAVPYLFSASRVLFDNEPFLMGMGFDITERKQQEAEREQLQQDVIEAQKTALQELSTPIIPLMESIIILPLVGTIDSYRARDITRNLLAGISQHRAKTVILDITGVPVVDSGVADYLNKTIKAARLKGAATVVTGLSDAVAETIVDLGIDWSSVDTLRDLQTGLMYALQQRGYTLQQR